MKMHIAFGFSFLCATLAFSASVTPIQKVITMLGGMLEKAKADKQAEAVEWSAFKEFCSNTELEKQKAIKKAIIQIASLDADIEQHNAEVDRLKREISTHESDIEGYEKDEKKATADRKTARDVYLTTHEDYSQSVDAIGKAIGILKERTADIPQAAAFLQKVQMPAEAKHALDAFIQMMGESRTDRLLGQQEPAANAYEFQSDSIVKMLLELKEKFGDERLALEKAEMESRQAYDMVMLDLRNAGNSASNEIAKKTQTKAENLQGSQESTTLLGETTTSKGDDEEYMSGLQTTCRTKASDFTARQTLREEGIVALNKAIEIISGDSVTGAADKHLPKLLQVSQGSSLVQFLSSSAKPNQAKALAFLNEESQRLDSTLLSALAMQAANDPFDKVKKMISDLISKLKAQAEEEADHKQWCDTELKNNGQNRKEKTDEVDQHTAAIDQLESRLAVLKKDLATLAQEIADINADVARETKNRAAEKDMNEATLVDAVTGQTAIAEAKKVLTDFFTKAGANTALVQEPPIFDEAFKGQQTQGNNVVAFLEVIASDFARLETETRKSEQEAQLSYDKSMEEAKASKEAKEKETKTKGKEQTDKTGTLSNEQDDLESAQAQLDAALDYFDKLKPSCVNVAVPYDERVQSREEEIASLKEALEILMNGVESGPESLYSSTQGGNLAVSYGM